MRSPSNSPRRKPLRRYGRRRWPNVGEASRMAAILGEKPPYELHPTKGWRLRQSLRWGLGYLG